MTMLEQRRQGHDAGGSSAEEADDYRRQVVRINADWRVIECRAGIQWILQRRRASGERVVPRWMSVAYHRHRDTLIVAVTRRCGDVRPDILSGLRCLPACFEARAELVSLRRSGRESITEMAVTDGTRNLGHLVAKGDGFECFNERDEYLCKEPTVAEARRAIIRAGRQSAA